MHLEKRFEIKRPVEEAARLLADDATFTELFPDAETEIVESTPERKTTKTHYQALGREGVATFHFHFEPDGSIRFEKVCDGRVWRELKGEIRLQPRGEDKTRVHLELEGRTKSLVPEFTIRGPMRDQLEQMARALKKRLSPPAAKRKRS